MFNIIITVILVSAFFILFFEPNRSPKNKRDKVKKSKVSTTDGFVEDTSSGPFIKNFVPPPLGDTGTFVAYSTVPEDNWLHGFPHKKSK